MAGFLKALQQPEYDHVLLNHFPITGLFIALLFLIVATAVNNRTGQFVSLVMVALLALTFLPVAHFGKEAYDRVLAMSDDAGGQWLKHHAHLARRWGFVYYITSAAAAMALLVGWRKPRLLRAASVIVVVLTVASLIAGAAIAEAGGMIRHREFRYGPPPAQPGETT